METQTLDVTYDNIVNVNATGTLRVKELKAADSAKITIDGDVHTNNGSFTSGNGVLSGSGNLFVGEVGYDPNAGTPYPKATVAFNKANLEGFVGDNQQAEGHVVLKNNSTLDLSSDANEVNLSDYTFAAYDESTGTDPTAQISVDAEAVNDKAATGAHIKGSKLTVDSNLVDDGSTLNLALEADALSLGGNASYDNTKGFGFDTADARNVTFEDSADPNNPSSSVVLREQLNLQSTTVSNGKTVADVGNSSGDVTINGGTKSYHVLYGNYTHNGNMTVSGGTLDVGYSSADGTTAPVDASLAVNGNFKLDNTAGANTINVNCHSGASATLDLTTATNDASTPILDRGSNLTTINVGNVAAGAGTVTNDKLGESTLKVTVDQLEQLLTDAEPSSADSGAVIVLGANGTLDVTNKANDAAVNLNLDTLISGSPASDGQIVFNEGGILNVNGAVTLSNANGQTADLGKGTLNTKGMKLSGADTTFAFQSGTVNVDVSAQQTPPATDPVVALGGAADTDIGQTVQLGDGTQTQDVTFNFKGADGTNYAINADLALNGTDSGSANVNLESGNWTAQNIKVSGAANNIQIGTTPAGVTNNTNLTVKDVTLDQGANLAVTGNKLTVTGNANFLQGTLNGDAKLEVSGEGAQAQLTATKFNDFVTKDNADPSDTESSVTLASGGKLYLQGTEQVTLTTDSAQTADNTFVLDTDPTAGSGDIHISGTHGTDPNNTIAADNLAVDSNLNSGNALALDLAATYLTLGGNASYNNTQGFGFDGHCDPALT